MHTITCDTCDETLEWDAGYSLQHLGGKTGYFHTIVADPPAEED